MDFNDNVAFERAMREFKNLKLSVDIPDTCKFMIFTSLYSQEKIKVQEEAIIAMSESFEKYKKKNEEAN